MRIARVSFTGDRSYELSVPAGRASALRARIVEPLPAFGGGLLGLEALMILRAEKGYIVIGKDTDGTTMPQDLGITGPRDQRKDEYIGKRSLFLPVANDKGRRQLVGSERRARRNAAADRRACRRRRRQVAPFAGLRDLELYEPEPRPSGCARPRRGRACRAWARRFGVYHLGAERRAAIAPIVALDPEGKRLHA